MLINVIKGGHPFYDLGEHDVEKERANYLIRIGVAEEKGIEYPEDKNKKPAKKKK